MSTLEEAICGIVFGGVARVAQVLYTCLQTQTRVDGQYIYGKAFAQPTPAVPCVAHGAHSSHRTLTLTLPGTRTAPGTRSSRRTLTLTLTLAPGTGSSRRSTGSCKQGIPAWYRWILQASANVVCNVREAFGGAARNRQTQHAADSQLIALFPSQNTATLSSVTR